MPLITPQEGEDAILRRKRETARARRMSHNVASLAWAAGLGLPLTDRDGDSALWNTPLVTVVITHYNRGVMLRQAIHSVF